MRELRRVKWEPRFASYRCAKCKLEFVRGDEIVTTGPVHFICMYVTRGLGREGNIDGMTVPAFIRGTQPAGYRGLYELGDIVGVRGVGIELAVELHLLHLIRLALMDDVAMPDGWEVIFRLGEHVTEAAVRELSLHELTKSAERLLRSRPQGVRS